MVGLGDAAFGVAGFGTAGEAGRSNAGRGQFRTGMATQASFGMVGRGRAGHGSARQGLAGNFFWSSMSSTKKCKCPVGSPFHWHEDKSPTVFMKDVTFRASADLSAKSTATVERTRKAGKPAGSIYGISRNREAELLRMRTFSIFSLAGKP